jgi:hypothetical protein
MSRHFSAYGKVAQNLHAEISWENVSIAENPLTGTISGAFLPSDIQVVSTPAPFDTVPPNFDGAFVSRLWGSLLASMEEGSLANWVIDLGSKRQMQSMFEKSLI